MANPPDNWNRSCSTNSLISKLSKVSSDSGSRKAPSHASERTSTTDNSLYLQGRSRDGDQAEMAPFVNEEKLQLERIVAHRDERLRARRLFLQEDRGIRGICFRFVDNTGSKVISHIVACATFLLVIIQANLSAEMLRRPEDASLVSMNSGLEVVMKVLISMYVLEVLIGLIGCPAKPWFSDGWLVLDVIIASVAVLDEFIIDTFNSMGIFRSTRAMRLLRILRVGRILTTLSAIRSFPLIANVAAETSVRLLWMFGFWSVMGWCAAVIVTVIIGAEGLAQIPEIQDPLLQAIVATGSSQPQTAEQLVSGLGGSLLVINLIPLRLLYWGPGIIWKLLVVENTRMNAGGLLILVYCSLCIVWIWPMVVGTFISALREGQTTDMRRKVAAAREAAEISVVDLIDMFEDLVQDSTERFISLDDFRDLHTQCPAISSLLGGGSKLNFTEIIFRDMDVMGHHFLTLPDFVLGFLKLIRVMPQAEFMHMDEQQRRALKNFKKISDSNRFSFLVTNRYLKELRVQMAQLLKISQYVIDAKVRPTAVELPSQMLTAVTEVEKKAISSSFRAKMQAKYNFTSRINKVETQVKEMNERSKSSSDALKNCFEQVTQQILQEDIMPWLSTEIPQYMAKRRARQRLARREAVEIPVKQAVPEPVPPPSPVPVLAAPSPTSPSPASPTKGFRLAESLLVAGAEFGQPQTQSI